ncbi:3-deoxy-D-manno-octulosonic acid transferase [Flavobacterium okayamense]|uniref:3-deoxy-D-manno-octulosonic acid transferase n=1 Tax=Flavobacterium okayamense TaxID=2830782 RepID=A0ABM7S133_9FLAO|nr:glycosyltransferase N-terminal domain-containing protein [Flavobacterium okayamense]BCY27442.1 3-deoxy-D-manno-octulosonic acid transferase [Flavobacterium okayamense]
MLFLYTILTHIASLILKVLALFSPKLKLFVKGRKDVFSTLKTKINSTDKVIWVHAASLGEYEQGIPVMEALKKEFPTHKLVVTFFSPSGYEVRKNNTLADVTVYLPLDTKPNAKKFIKITHPELVLFIKYEFWPNYLNELKRLNISTYLVSGIFREKQAFFKWYGRFYRDALKTFNHFFVQNDSSKQLIQSIGFNNVTISGDTRFDRVVDILNRDNSLDFIENFRFLDSARNDKATLIVIGSSWPKDEELLVNYINQSSDEIKFIIAPHNIKQDQISNLKSSIKKKTILFSEKENQNLSEFEVFIIDTIGILTKIYSYADIAYVGGGFGNPGVHNILEPATFGVPIVIGPNYSHFAEAIALVHQEGCLSIKNETELKLAFDSLLYNSDERNEKGHICETFVQMNKGATTKIITHILNKNLNKQR